MLKGKVEQALNEQVNAELFSSYLYLSMSAYFERSGLKGFAQWMRVQAREELDHAMKIYDFINERGGKALLKALEEPEHDWPGTAEVLDATLEHERYITGRINDLVALAREELDPATEIFLQWFVNEQVEEEASAEDLINGFNLTGGKGGSLYHLDKELGQRVYTPSANTEE